MLHLTDEERRSAALEPVVGDFSLVEALQQAERIVYIGGLLGKTVAVILQLQLGMHLLGGTFVHFSKHRNVGGHVGCKLFFRNAADGRILGIHRNISEIIDG